MLWKWVKVINAFDGRNKKKIKNAVDSFIPYTPIGMAYRYSIYKSLTCSRIEAE